jgi:hypothetical protein
MPLLLSLRLLASQANYLDPDVALRGLYNTAVSLAFPQLSNFYACTSRSRVDFNDARLLWKDDSPLRPVRIRALGIPKPI